MLRSLQSAATPNTVYARITVDNCARDVVLDSIAPQTENQSFPYQRFGTALTVRNSAHVALHRSSLHGLPAMSVDRSQVTCTTTTLTGRSVTPNAMAGPAYYAVDALATRLWFAATTVSGGGDFHRQLNTPAPGLVLRSSLVTAAGGSVNGGGIPFLALAASVDLDSGSWVERDNAVTFNSNFTGAPGNTSVAETGRVAGGLNAAGQTEMFTFAAAAGTFGFLVMSLPGPEVASPGGPVWLFLPTSELVAVGQLPLQAAVASPALAPRGFALLLQGAVLDQGVVRLSTPLVTAVR